MSSTTTTITHPDGTVISCSTAAAAALAKPSSLKLHYFQGRGLAEISRQMLAVAGVPFDDAKYPIAGSFTAGFIKAEMEAEAAKGTFDANMGRLPVLEVSYPTGEAFTVGGSKSVQRFIATTYGLNGSTPSQMVAIDALCECVGDARAAFGKAEDKDDWFVNGSDVQGKRALPWYLKSMNSLVAGGGFAVGGGISMADAVLYNMFGETATTAGLFGNTQSEPMDSAQKTAVALAQFAPNIAAVVANFRADAKMQAYLAARVDLAF